MTNNSNKAYRAEREAAIIMLESIVTKYRLELNRQAETYNQFVDEESAVLIQAYVPAQLALLKLMKEESEENGDE